MDSIILIPVALLSLSVYYLVSRNKKATTSSLPLPPGPPGLPIIGNILQLPSSHAWIRFQGWAKEFGPIVHLNLAGQSLVVLNTEQAAHDVLAKQGMTFSDRPFFPAATELSKMGMHYLIMSYDAHFRLYQKLQAPFLSKGVAASYRPLQHLESRRFLWDLLHADNERGTDCYGPIKRMFGSFIYTLMYGRRLLSSEDPYLRTADDVVNSFVRKIKPGASIVDMFPFLNILPAPMAPWKSRARKHWKEESALHVKNYRNALTTSNWNASKHLKGAADSLQADMSDLELSFVCGNLLLAALEASSQTFRWFLVACVTQSVDKSWMRRAQDELDAVVGHERLPTFDDRPRLPYVEAVLSELLRWRPAGPLSFPHSNKVEGSYAGYRIPKDSVVVSNIFSIGLNEAVYGAKYDVAHFVPDRWLQGGGRSGGGDGSDGGNQDHDGAEGGGRGGGQQSELPPVGFGYGRRKCPGLHIADSTLWILIAHVLWAFDVRPGLSESGEPLPVDADRGDDAIVHSPPAFRVRFLARGGDGGGGSGHGWARDAIVRDGDTSDADHAVMLDRIGEAVRGGGS